ncbi:MAG: hypothetical protein H6817_07385 [Phycisphaerales bacterium]|nr:hypothetical protein [Phycisphaerales bacterium]
MLSTCRRTAAVSAALPPSGLGRSGDICDYRRVHDVHRRRGDGDGVGWSIPNGTKLYGTFTFDTSTPDDTRAIPRGRYFDTIVDLS